MSNRFDCEIPALEFQIVLNSFATALRTKDLVITSELLLAPQFGEEQIREQADLLRGHVDAMLVTDNQSGRLHMSSLAASQLLKQSGVEPIMQLGCRNRNRIALLGDLLGASALGIRNLQLVRGERVPEGFVPRPKAILDITATELIEIARKMQVEEGIAYFPDLLLGGIVTPRIPKPAWPATKLVEKVAAGAQFLVTQTCMDAEIIRKYVEHLVRLKVTHSASVFASIAVLKSAEDARWLHENKTNVTVPNWMIRDIEEHATPRTRGIEIAAELLRDFASIPGLSGVHIYSPTDIQAVKEVLSIANQGS